MKRAQTGASLIVVLVLLTVLLLGGLTMARSGANGGLIAGNAAFRAAALDASEIGLSDAFVQLQALTAEDTGDATHGYYASRQPDGATPDVPAVSWPDLPATAVGQYQVRHVLERLCTTTPVTDAASQCVVRMVQPDGSRKTDGFVAPPQIGKQYRVTVRVTGPHDTEVIVQDLMVR